MWCVAAYIISDLSMLASICDDASLVVVSKYFFFADSKMEMLNLNCKLIHFIHHLKERCGLDFKGT